MTRLQSHCSEFNQNTVSTVSSLVNHNAVNEWALCVCQSLSDCYCPCPQPVYLALQWRSSGCSKRHFLSASSWRLGLLHLYHTVSLCGHALHCPKPINMYQSRCTSRHGRREPCPLSASSWCSKLTRPHCTAIEYEFCKHHVAISIDLLFIVTLVQVFLVVLGNDNQVKKQTVLQLILACNGQYPIASIS